MIENRGGTPSNRSVAVSSTAAGHTPGTLTPTGYRPGGVAKFLALQNEGTVAVRVAWSAEEMAAGHYFTLAPNTDTAGRDRWQGPVELADDRDMVWLATAASTSTVCITFFQRRG